MSGVINPSRIWKIVGVVSAINGMVCFGLSSTYNKSFGKLGIGGLIIYVLLCLIMWCLIMFGKRTRAPEKVDGRVAALIFVVMGLISMVHDELVTWKSDALTIISYGSFALMSVSMSRKFELGFETGFFAIFLQLFVAQLLKIKWFLLPIALLFFLVALFLRHNYSSESSGGVQSDFIDSLIPSKAEEEALVRKMEEGDQLSA